MYRGEVAVFQSDFYRPQRASYGETSRSKTMVRLVLAQSLPDWFDRNPNRQRSDFMDETPYKTNLKKETNTKVSLDILHKGNSSRECHRFDG